MSPTTPIAPDEDPPEEAPDPDARAEVPPEPDADALQEEPSGPGAPDRSRFWRNPVRGVVRGVQFLDTRAAAARLFGPVRRSVPKAVLLFIACLGAGAAVAWLPTHDGLTAAGTRALFILVAATCLWVTEAIPAFAVGLLVIAANIILLGQPTADPLAGPGWERFVAPWGSPLLWLFFGGFVLAAGAARTGLDRRSARWILARFGEQPKRLLAGVMAIAFLGSMFMSNTATTAMMVGLLAPLLARLAPAAGEPADPLAKALVLGAAFAANIGGMTTLIGSPPNAIAAAALIGLHEVSFAEWMAISLPVGLLLAVGVWALLARRYRSRHARVDLTALLGGDGAPGVPRWKAKVAAVTVIGTIVMWLTTSLHGVPTAAIAVMPIAIFTVTGILEEGDIRGLSWDVLLLIAGGMSLGIAVSETGLAEWLVAALPVEAVGALGAALILAYVTTLMSNVMSNTAAANILVPIAVTIGGAAAPSVVIPVALAASAAMCLPISTPPNAIAYGTGAIATRDLVVNGLLVTLVAPGIAVLWVWLVT